LTYLLILGIKEEVIPEPLNLTVSLRGTLDIQDQQQIFRLTGLLDAFSEPTFRKVVGEYLGKGPSNVILDLSTIDFLDSSGLGALVQLAKQAKNQNGNLHIVTNPRVTQTVKLVRLEKFLPLYATIDQAVEALPDSSS
jgi:anti-anti-sigma factor